VGHTEIWKDRLVVRNAYEISPFAISPLQDLTLCNMDIYLDITAIALRMRRQVIICLLALYVSAIKVANLNRDQATQKEITES
jgi:hypothetical protein